MFRELGQMLWLLGSTVRGFPQVFRRRRAVGAGRAEDETKAHEPGKGDGDDHTLHATVSSDRRTAPCGRHEPRRTSTIGVTHRV